ncbi:MAG: HPr family phosphocarrier protein [Nanoarchaeota archaeon]|nr:HPr family phosphocarrier protein [Nanoarchaeota archaeon]
MNKLKQLYNGIEAKQGRSYDAAQMIIALDPARAQDRRVIDSFVAEHFAESVDAKVHGAEVFADVQNTLKGLEADVLVRYHDQKGDHAYYFELTAANDPSLASVVDGMVQNGEAVHLHVTGRDQLAALQRLTAYFAAPKYGDIRRGQDYHTMVCAPKNKLGLHTRPASLVTRLASEYKDTTLDCYNPNTGTWNPAGILSLLLLGAGTGKEVNFRAKGPHAEELLQKVNGLFQAKFNEG